MRVNIKTAAARLIALNVEPSDTVFALKVKIQDCEGIPPEYQALVVGVVQLDDARTLADCCIAEGSTVHLVLCEFFCYRREQTPALTISVNMGECRVARLQVRPADSVTSLKAKIQDAIGILADQFWVYSSGLKFYEDGRSLHECELQDDSVVYIVMHMGSSEPSSQKAMQIFVKLPSRRTIALSAAPSDTIASLKAAVCAAAGQDDGGGVIQPGLLNLVLGLQHLADARTLADCRVYADTVLLAVVP